MHFADRRDAGRRLATALTALSDADLLILALPRGGVPVAAEIAAALGAPLDIIGVRKIGAPGQPELALGALVDGTPPEMVLNEEVAATLPGIEIHLVAERARQEEELARRRRLYLGDRPRAKVAGRTAIVVDDGLATGATMRAALIGVRRQGPRRLVLAVPVAPPETLARLEGEVDEVVCLAAPRHFFAIGVFYDDFHQVPDAEVVALLEAARAAGG
jgi:putative phosphoribosyl transferase